VWQVLGELVARSRLRALLVVGIWVLLAGIVPQLAPTVDEVRQEGGTNAPVPGSQSAAARDLLLQSFPDQQGVPAVIVVHNPDGLDAAAESEIARITSALAGPDRPAHVDGVVSTATMPQARATLVSTDGTTSTILASITGLASNDEQFAETVRQIRAIAGTGDGDMEIRLTGPAGIATDTVEIFRNADLVLLAFTVLLVLVLLLVIYRAPLLALIPLLGVGIAMQLTNAVGAALAKAGIIAIDSSAESIMTVLLFGAGTDYALFLLMRFREEMAVEPDRPAAMRSALKRVGAAILSSGFTVVLALLTMLLAVVPSTREFGPFLALGVGSVMLVSLTFVPAMLTLLGRAAFWPLKRLHRDPAERSPWGRIGAAVARRPATLAAASTVLLGALAAGTLGYQPNANLISDLRGESDSQRGQQLLEQAFPQGQLAPTVVLVQADHPGPAAGVVADAIRDIDGVSRVDAPVVAPAGGVARLQVVYDDDPYGTPALERTQQVRDVSARALPGGTVLVGGESANALDNRRGDIRDFTVVAVAMAVLIVAVLSVLLRALLAPLLLLATTALSLLSALGATVLTWVVIAGQAGTNNRVLLYSLIFLVALGVDYNILLASRIREEMETHGFAEGVRVALTRTGGVITSAGLILAGTFAVLMTQPLNSLLQFGFAMAVGLLLDTFVIRGILVPALFLLVGPRVWFPSRTDHGAVGPSTPRPEAYLGLDRPPGG
jgi:RND superfamily putative drug exporter